MEAGAVMQGIFLLAFLVMGKLMLCMGKNITLNTFTNALELGNGNGSCFSLQGKFDYVRRDESVNVKSQI